MIIYDVEKFNKIFSRRHKQEIVVCISVKTDANTLQIVVNTTEYKLCNGGKDASKVYDYATNKTTDGRCMINETSKIFFIFKHRGVRKTDPSFKHDYYHPNWGFQYANQDGDMVDYDLEQKMSHGTFNDLEQFILSLKQLAKLKPNSYGE